MTATDYLRSQSFEPDAFQLEAAAAIDRGESVVVTAPTGAGKSATAAVMPEVRTTLPDKCAGSIWPS